MCSRAEGEFVDLDHPERHYQMLAKSLADRAIYMLDPEGGVASWNLGAERLLGYSEDDILGACYSRFFRNEDRARGHPAAALSIAANEGCYEAKEWRIRQDGSNFLARVLIEAVHNENGALIGFAHITIDLTERNRLERQMSQMHNSEATGHFIGGVAHRLNNMLNVIVGNIDSLLEDDRVPEDTKVIASDALNSAWKVSRLSNQMLVFSRNHAQQKKAVEISGFLQSMEPLIKRSVNDHIEISLPVNKGPCPAIVDPGQLETAIMNLVGNSRDAMPRGGRLVVECSNLVLDAHEADQEGLSGSAYVCISVSDTGGGISKDVLERVFEPFFTTKGSGMASGLGLSMVYDFARRSGGTVRISCEPGRRTQIRIFLPRALEEVHVSSPVEAQDAGVQTGGTRLLLRQR